MSIIIASIDHLTRVVYIAADHRSMDFEGNFVSDNNTKIFKLREGVYYGMSGLVSECLRMKSLLTDNKNLPVSQLIQLAENFATKNTTHEGKIHGATFVIAGMYDDCKPFVWSKTSYQKECDAEEEKGLFYLETKVVGNLVRLPSVTVSAPNQSTANAVQPNFVSHMIKTGSYSKAMLISIGNASKIDKAISPSIDLHIFDTGNMKATSETITLENV